MIIYDIQMLTPLGKKYGQMHVESQNGRLSGMLSLLGESQPIDGRVQSDGRCEFSGRLITLLNTIEYCAKGTINSDQIQFSMEGRGKVYPVTGIRREKTVL